MAENVHYCLLLAPFLTLVIHVFLVILFLHSNECNSLCVITFCLIPSLSSAHVAYNIPQLVELHEEGE